FIWATVVGIILMNILAKSKKFQGTESGISGSGAAVDDNRRLCDDRLFAVDQPAPVPGRQTFKFARFFRDADRYHLNRNGTREGGRSWLSVQHSRQPGYGQCFSDDVWRSAAASFKCSSRRLRTKRTNYVSLHVIGTACLFCGADWCIALPDTKNSMSGGDAPLSFLF